MASEQDHLDAQFQLGILYFEGKFLNKILMKHLSILH